MHTDHYMALSLYTPHTNHHSHIQPLEFFQIVDYRFSGRKNDLLRWHVGDNGRRLRMRR